jgi:hypothetical protein
MEFMAAFKGVGNLAMALVGKLARARPPCKATAVRNALAVASIERINIIRLTKLFANLWKITFCRPLNANCSEINKILV